VVLVVAVVVPTVVLELLVKVSVEEISQVLVEVTIHILGELLVEVALEDRVLTEDMILEVELVELEQLHLLLDLL
jgi:hypothetical protein